MHLLGCRSAVNPIPRILSAWIRIAGPELVDQTLAKTGNSSAHVRGGSICPFGAVSVLHTAFARSGLRLGIPGVYSEWLILPRFHSIPSLQNRLR
jgi:hypothetical protein